MKYVFASLALFASVAAQAATCTNLPVGAEALGYTTQLFYDEPDLAEVSATDTDKTSKWYPGSFSSPVANNLAQRKELSTSGTELAIGLGGGVSSQTQASTAGAMPYLDGTKGFYVEFAMHLSSNNTDHFSGLFLMTAEHNLAKADHLSTDPAGYERWTEIDVSEDGYGKGSLESVINWSGIYPHYSASTANSYGWDKAIDWTTEHRFGVSYDPNTNTLQWYLDDEPTWKSTAGTHIKNWHYYLVMEASSHGSHIPYDMYIHYVRAYSK